MERIRCKTINERNWELNLKKIGKGVFVTIFHMGTLEKMNLE